jgi:adenylylsulfate kinase
MDTLRKRDQKGLYSGITNETEKEVAGLHFHVEEPKHPDLILENDGEKTPEEQVEKLMEDKYVTIL